MKNYLLIFLFLSSIFLCQSQVVVIDPGHGYGVNGENKDGRTEAEITTNCEVGLKLEKLLKAVGYTTYLTRNHSGNGSWVSVTQRATMADSWGADRLLSIHCNGGGGTGTETFFCERNTANRKTDSLFAKKVQEKMALIGVWKSRRYVEDFLYLKFHLGVLSGVATGCLNEIGFVDTQSDLQKLLDDGWRNKFAQAYLEAIKENLASSADIYLATQVSDFQLFPNPNFGTFSISTIQGGKCKVVIKSLQGTVLKTLFLQQSIHVSVFLDLPKGIYIAELLQSDKIQTKLMVVQ